MAPKEIPRENPEASTEELLAQTLKKIQDSFK